MWNSVVPFIAMPIALITLTVSAKAADRQNVALALSEAQIASIDRQTEQKAAPAALRLAAVV